MADFDIGKSIEHNVILSAQTGMSADELTKIDMQRSIMGIENSDDPIANIGNNAILGKDLYNIDVIDTINNK